MTGGGVNDAPALKRANCGFAVANATDAACAAADIILTTPGLSVINHTIRQARITFERMKSYATFGTEILGTLIAVYGLIITAISWQHALYIWAYALAWFVVNDAIKQGTYHLLRGRRSA